MEWGLARKPLTTGPCPVITKPIDSQGSPCWQPTTTVSTSSGHRGGKTWLRPIGSMSSSVTSLDSNFTQQIANLGYIIYLVSTSCKDARLIRSKLVVVQYTSGELFTVVPNRLLCSPTDASLVRATGAFCETPNALCTTTFWGYLPLPRG